MLYLAEFQWYVWLNFSVALALLFEKILQIPICNKLQFTAIANNTIRMPRTAIPWIIGMENTRFGHFPGQ